MKKLNWIDILVYKLFYWRWNKILSQRPDLIKLIQKSLFMYCEYNFHKSVGDVVLPKVTECPK